MKKYDSIPRYGKQGTRDILGTEVVVMEKLECGCSWWTKQFLLDYITSNAK